jgi:hypothetical protein
LFPGLGSAFGGILPGVVFTTGVGPNNTSRPDSFSAMPIYNVDAPFINRTWGTTSFNSMDFGFKWRFNSPSDSSGHGITAFWRWYLDKADDFAGFNQMQRGAGPGSKWGDFGVSYFADSRVAKWANVSFNVGYTFTTKSEASFNGTDFVIYDPADQFTWGVGLDFPVNKHFQPILEFRQAYYLRSRTPNALENDPSDGLAGVRISPARWWGMSFAYRYHFNQQDFDSFEDDSTSSTVSILCPPGAPTACTTQTISVTRTGLPPGVGVSSDSHGYLAQLFIGRRDKRAGEVVNQPANVESVTLGTTVIKLPCRPGTVPREGTTCPDNKTISVSTVARDPENDVLTYNYTVSGGRIVGTGANVTWDLSSAQAGTYTITTGVDDGCGVCGRTDTKTIRVEECDCVTPPPVLQCNCPTLNVTGPAGLTNPGDTMTFTASAAGDLTYNWTVSAGTIESGQGTPSITVRTTREMGGSNVTATVNIGGTDPACNCPTSDSETAGVASVPTSTITDEFGTATDDDVKARVDNFYIQLNNNPTAQGYIINYGTPAQIRRRRAQIMKAINFRKYDASRVTFVDGPDNGGVLNTKFYIVPQGASNPTP